MALYRFRQFALSGSGDRRTAIVAGAVGAGFFETLHAFSRRVGRVFLPEEDTPAGKHVDDRERSFLGERDSAAAPDVVGRTLTLDDEALHDRRRHARTRNSRRVGSDGE